MLNLNSGFFSAMDVNTTPGSPGNNPFTPPESFSGSSEDYVHLLRRRFKSREHNHRMQAVVRLYHHPDASRKVEFTGPFSFDAWNVVAKLKYRPDINSI